MIERDGTSQAGRVQAALDPGYVAVDERSPLDLLSFARAYAGELRYYDERGRPAGDWSAFLDADLGALAALVEEPGRLTEGEARRLGKPHTALFLAFLRLLGHPRDLINTLTRRHLEFYYEQVLRMSRKAAVPDRVHVLFRPAAGVAQARLPAGSLLRAGKDSLGRERVYRTDRDLVVSRARIARLSSVYAEKEIVGIREARELHRDTPEALLRMLEIALGDPRPGDPLPSYQEREVTVGLLADVKKLLDFSEKPLFMPRSDLHSMMQLKRRRDGADAEWSEINRILEAAGRARLGNPEWRLAPDDPRDFPANLAKAIGGELDFEHDGIPNVRSLEDLYERLVDDEGPDDGDLRDRIREFIKDKLHLEDAGLFVRMMQIKIRIDDEWREINRILERAGRRKRENVSYKLDPANPLAAFEANLEDAIGRLDFSTLGLSVLPGVSDIEEYHRAILAIEAYFHMNADQVAYVMAVAEKPVQAGATAGEWNNVYRLLAEAHEEKAYGRRRAALQSALEGAASEAAGFSAMLRIALGKDASEAEEPPLLELREYVRSTSDYGFLEGIQARLGGGSITSEEWARVYRVLELAQRIRERLPEPVAQRETWLNLHAAADATSVAAAPAGEAGLKQRRWKTFGKRLPEATEARPPPAVIGWALCSPMLCLRQGTRTIVLTLGFRADRFDANQLIELLKQDPFGVELSTEKGWLALPAAATVGDYRELSKVSATLEEPLKAIQLTVSLGEDAAAIAPPSRDAAGIATPWPMLRLMLRPVWSAERKQYIAHYASFRDLTLAAVHVHVEVGGLTPSALQSDEASLNPKRPFEPFGTSPAVGSRFYVGDPELVIKRLDSLTFHVEWRGVPQSSLNSYYTNYGITKDFTTRISLVDNHLELPLAKAAALFASDATLPHEIKLADVPALLSASGTTHRYEALPELPAKAEVSAWPRYIQWELTPIDFQHGVYPAVATQQALAMAKALLTAPAGADPASFRVNPPYTPRMKSLRVDYTASAEVDVGEVGRGGRADRLFHVHPFGISAIEADAEGGEIRFLPRYDHEGELYIGIEGAQPPQTLSLLFQMAEGSASPDLRPVPIAWSYLSGDRWLTLHEGNLLLDTTRGLINSGIVEIALQPAEPSTRLPGDLTWIRAAIPHHADSVCDAVAIHAQAVSATFVDRGNAPDHYGQQLPERSITRLLERAPQIAGVEQPYTSRGGRAAEGERGFATRVSERLRHKQRALTIWDYERLVLERFPEIYKVKCIPGGAGQPSDSPGAVQIIVIPDVRGQSGANPFEPKAPANLIADIEAYLADKCPAQAAVRVRNAHYVPVKVRVGVRFRDGRDEGFYKKLLNEEINRFLSPWAYDEGADITIGRKIFANSIVNFIDEREYVDFVATIKLFSGEDGLAQPVAGQGYFVATDRPDGVLVAAQQHVIDVITEAGYVEKNFTGINYMKIELDFVVAGSG
ncbi:baseplate J/gp47 family protein [Sorangium sp. So ce385]|uniref:baseplate J/gp47 family protein n=1 Tax=Sorangium sp. So ce385 TaxID=3133308 RepID=UPI003F5C4758